MIYTKGLEYGNDTRHRLKRKPFFSDIKNQERDEIGVVDI